MRGRRGKAGCGGVRGSERRGDERKPSRWRLFCSRGSVSEHKPCAAAPISPAAPNIPHMHACTHTCTHTPLHPHRLCTHQQVHFSLVFCTVFFFFCTPDNVHADVSVSLTASDDAKALGGERRGAVPSHTMLLSHWISQAPVRAGGQAGWLAGWTAEAHSSGNDTALLHWERVTAHDGVQRGHSGIKASASSLT